MHVGWQCFCLLNHVKHRAGRKVGLIAARRTGRIRGTKKLVTKGGDKE